MSDTTATSTYIVPDFFQDDGAEAQRQRVEWQREHLGLDDEFFAAVLRIDPQIFAAWRREAGTLDEESLATLREWWETVLLLHGSDSGDTDRMRWQIEVLPRPGVVASLSKYTPSWTGSIKQHLQTNGRSAIDDVYRWLSLFHYRD